MYVFIVVVFPMESKQENNNRVVRSRVEEPSRIFTISSLIPNPLIYNIFGRLPPKSLIRFMSLSRSCRGLISMPFFQRFHHDYSASRKLKLLFRQTDLGFDGHGNCIYGFVWIDSPQQGIPTSLVSPPFRLKVIDPIRLILPSCLGVFCFATLTLVYVCNPTLGQLLRLPSQDPQGTVLAGFAFGFLHTLGVIKVVKLTEGCSRSGTLSCSVFTLGLAQRHQNTTSRSDDRCWRDLNVSCPYFVEPFAVPATVKTNVYWKINRRRISDPSRDLACILAFSLRCEKFKVIDKPVGCEEETHKNYVQLVELTDKLFLAEMCPGLRRVRMWELKDMSNSMWSCFVIDLGGVDKGLNAIEVKGMNSNQEIVFSSGTNVLIYYHITRKTCRHVTLPLPHFTDFFVCNESIASIIRPM